MEPLPRDLFGGSLDADAEIFSEVLLSLLDTNEEELGVSPHMKREATAISSPNSVIPPQPQGTSFPGFRLPSMSPAKKDATPHCQRHEASGCHPMSAATPQCGNTASTVSRHLPALRRGKGSFPHTRHPVLLQVQEEAQRLAQLAVDSWPEDEDSCLGKRKLGKNEPPLSKEAKKQRRLIRNRMSAQLHRERKKAYVESLERKVRELAALNEKLRAQMDEIAADRDALRLRCGEPCVPYVPHSRPQGNEAQPEYEPSPSGSPLGSGPSSPASAGGGAAGVGVMALALVFTFALFGGPKLGHLAGMHMEAVGPFGASDVGSAQGVPQPDFFGDSAVHRGAGGRVLLSTFDPDAVARDSHSDVMEPDVGVEVREENAQQGVPDPLPRDHMPPQHASKALSIWPCDSCGDPPRTSRAHIQPPAISAGAQGVSHVYDVLHKSEESRALWAPTSLNTAAFKRVLDVKLSEHRGSTSTARPAARSSKALALRGERRRVESLEAMESYIASVLPEGPLSSDSLLTCPTVGGVVSAQAMRYAYNATKHAHQDGPPDSAHEDYTADEAHRVQTDAAAPEVTKSKKKIRPQSSHRGVALREYDYGEPSTRQSRSPRLSGHNTGNDDTLDSAPYLHLLVPADTIQWGPWAPNNTGKPSGYMEIGCRIQDIRPVQF